MATLSSCVVSPIRTVCNTALSICPSKPKSTSGFVEQGSSSFSRGTPLETINLQSCVGIAIVTDRSEFFLGHFDSASQIKPAFDFLRSKMKGIPVRATLCGGEEASSVTPCCTVTQAIKYYLVTQCFSCSSPLSLLAAIGCELCFESTGAPGSEITDSLTRTTAISYLNSFCKEYSISPNILPPSIDTYSMSITKNGNIQTATVDISYSMTTQAGYDKRMESLKKSDDSFGRSCFSALTVMEVPRLRTVVSETTSGVVPLQSKMK